VSAEFAPLSDGPVRGTQADLAQYAPGLADGPVEPDEVPAVELDAAGRAYLADYEEALAERRALDAQIEHLAEQLKKLIGDAHEARVDGEPVLSYRPHTRRGFSQALARRFLTEEQFAACQSATLVRPFKQVSR
jgi:hypothetical protein